METLTVTAEDATNTVVTTYTGTVFFSSTDPLGILPSSYTFIPFDAGTHAFSVEFRTLGSQTLTVTDRGGRVGLNSVSVPIDGFPANYLHGSPW
jgi:hypothetical protein